MKNWICGFLCVIFAVSLIGCETVKGLGKDLENTGENINETVDKL